MNGDKSGLIIHSSIMRNEINKKFLKLFIKHYTAIKESEDNILRMFR